MKPLALNLGLGGTEESKMGREVRKRSQNEYALAVLTTTEVQRDVCYG